MSPRASLTLEHGDLVTLTITAPPMGSRAAASVPAARLSHSDSAASQRGEDHLEHEGWGPGWGAQHPNSVHKACHRVISKRELAAQHPN